LQVLKWISLVQTNSKWQALLISIITFVFQAWLPPCAALLCLHALTRFVHDKTVFLSDKQVLWSAKCQIVHSFVCSHRGSVLVCSCLFGSHVCTKRDQKDGSGNILWFPHIYTVSFGIKCLDEIIRIFYNSGIKIGPADIFLLT
jgi:hypothetical protein